MSELLDRLLPPAKLAEAKQADVVAYWNREFAKARAAQAAAVAPAPARDKSLTWATVQHDVLGTVNVGGEYDEGEPARVTSTYAFVTSGDPGSPGQDAEFVVVEVIAQDTTGAERNLWAVLQHDVLDELAKLAIAALQAPATDEGG